MQPIVSPFPGVLKQMSFRKCSLGLEVYRKPHSHASPHPTVHAQSSHRLACVLSHPLWPGSWEATERHQYLLARTRGPCSTGFGTLGVLDVGPNTGYGTLGMRNFISLE